MNKLLGSATQDTKRRLKEHNLYETEIYISGPWINLYENGGVCEYKNRTQ